MKNDDEMYQSLLSRYEAYQEEKIQRKRIVRRIVPIAACFCLSVALGCSYWFHFRHIPTIPTLPETTEEQTTEQPATHPTETEANAEPAETIMTETVIPTETAPLPTDPTEPTVATAATSTPEPTNPTQPSQAAHTQTTTVPPRETTLRVDPTETAPATDPTEPEPTESSPIEPRTTEPFPIEPPPTEPYLTGDINGDREISIADIVTLHDHLTNSSSLDAEQLKRADINTDHRVDADDLALLKQTLLHKIEAPWIEKAHRALLQQTLEKWDMTDDGILYAREDCDGVFDLTIPNGGFCDRSELLQAMLQAYPDGIFAVELIVYPADDSYSYEAEQAYLQEQGITMQVAYQGAYVLGYAILRADQIEFFLPYQHAGYNMSLANGAYLNIP